MQLASLLLPRRSFVHLAFALSLAFGATAHLCAQAPCDPTQATGASPLNDAQQACVARVRLLTFCVIGCSFSAYGQSTPPPAGTPPPLTLPGLPQIGDDIPLINVTEPSAEHGMYSFPDTCPNNAQPMSQGTYSGSNGGAQVPPSSGNAIGIDPTCWSQPNAQGNVHWSPGSTDQPGQTPGDITQHQADAAFAASLYGEVGHQDLGCQYDATGNPASPADLEHFNASEAKVAKRAATFLRWLARCIDCWPTSGWPTANGTLTPVQKGKLAQYYELLADNADERARRFGG